MLTEWTFDPVQLALWRWPPSPTACEPAHCAVAVRHGRAQELAERR